MRLSHITIEYPDRNKFLKLLEKAISMGWPMLQAILEKRLENTYQRRSLTIMIM